jgi:hypothetical protein
MNGRSAPGVQANYANALQELTNHYPGPRPQLSTSCSQNGRGFRQLKAVIEFDG